MALFVLSLCPFDISVGVGACVIGLSQISSFFSWVGRAERGLVSRTDGDKSGRAGFERGCIRDTAWIQRELIGDRNALQSERVIFYPIKPNQAIKIGRYWSYVGRLSGVNVAL